MESLLTVVGVNHQTSAVSVREALAPRPDEAGRINDALRSAAGLTDGVVVSTCSRFEVYTTLDEIGVERIKDMFMRRAAQPLGDALYVHRGTDAVKHLFRVTAGLDSWVIGETEILGQVKSSYQHACEEKTASRPLHLSFQRALMVGKKVRTETSIVGGIASIGGAAAVLARRIFSKLDEQRLIVFGAGAMATSTVRHLSSKGISRLWVANRSPERARTLAEDLGGIAMSLEEGMSRLVEADVAVFSTGASNYLLDETIAREVMRQRNGRPIFIIDLGLPRNVDPGVAGIENIFVYDMDNLRQLVEDNLRRRESDLARAEAIVNMESADCWSRICVPAAPRTPSNSRQQEQTCPLRVNLPIMRTA
jgi:glutamyl-tRNA reductase